MTNVITKNVDDLILNIGRHVQGISRSVCEVIAKHRITCCCTKMQQCPKIATASYLVTFQVQHAVSMATKRDILLPTENDGFDNGLYLLPILSYSSCKNAV